MRRFIFLLLAAVALFSCRDYVLEDRGECLQIELFATVAGDGHLDVDLSIPVGSNTEKYYLAFDIDGNPVENWYRADDGNQPKRITIPDSRLLHLVIPKTTAGDHVLHARLYSDSYSAEAEVDFALDNLAISAEALATTGGYDISVFLERGRTELDYSIEVTLDGAPLKEISWKRSGFDPASFRFDDERRVIFSIPRQEVGEHSMAVRVTSGYLTASTTLLLRESNELQGALDVVPLSGGDYLIDIALVRGRTDVPYSLTLTYDGVHIDGLLTQDGKVIDFNKVTFKEDDPHLRLVLTQPTIGEHTVTAGLTDGKESVILSATFSRTNEMSAIVDGDVTYRDGRIWWDVLLVNGEQNVQYSAEVQLDHKAFDVRGEGFSLSSFRFPTGRVITMSAPLPDYNTHTITITITDGNSTSSSDKVFQISNDLKGKLVLYYALPGFNKEDGSEEGYFFDFERESGFDDLVYDVSLTVDGKNYSGSYEKKDVLLKDIVKYFVSLQGRGSHRFIMTLASYGKSWSFESTIREEHLAFEVKQGGTIYLKTSNGSFVRRMEYSKDAGKTWTMIEASLSGQPVSANVGDFVLWRGGEDALAEIRGKQIDFGYISSSPATATFFNYCSFATDKLQFSLSGNLDALLREDKSALKDAALAGVFAGCQGLVYTNPRNMGNRTAVLPDRELGKYCFAGLFEKTNITASPVELPYGTLAEGCYALMFLKSKISSAPALPAMSLAEDCYTGMYYGASDGTRNLPATKLARRCYYMMYAESGITACTLAGKTLAPICYAGMFEGSQLESAPALPVTTLESACYYEMFRYCKKLKDAPGLPAKVMVSSCYKGMFSGCTGMTSAPALPATTLAANCYEEMFSGCTSLAAVPALPATTLADACYRNMFSGCSSLTVAPALPATTLANGCYMEMFSDCSKLTSAPTLPATTLASACYAGMFSGCSKLAAVPALPATKLAAYCYQNMFESCKSLTNANITLPALTLEKSCYDGMFNYCTTLVSAPTISAVTLAENCCRNMFFECVKLTDAKPLLAKTLVKGCYEKMFYECVKLAKIEAHFTTTPSDAYTKEWVKRVAATGTFTKGAGVTWNVTGDNGVPSGWTIDYAN